MADKEFFRSSTKNEIKEKEFLNVDKIIDILNLKRPIKVTMQVFRVNLKGDKLI